jgi:hypothetical protein
LVEKIQSLSAVFFKASTCDCDHLWTFFEQKNLLILMSISVEVLSVVPNEEYFQKSFEIDIS